MKLKVESDVVASLIRDPVMAAYVLMGVRLDTFQEARLRYFWFVPEKIDSSGWSTGKTIVEFVYAWLRAALIPGQAIGVYYPIFQTGKDEFWKYFTVFRTPLMIAQYRGGSTGKSDWMDPGCWRWEFKNGSKIYLPAPGFLNDAQNQASRRFNTMIIGEYTIAASKGDGIDELLGRNTAASFNKHHPVWCNHVLMTAHAEDFQHPAYRYYKATREVIQGKRTAEEAHRNALVTFCYRDWSNKPVDPLQPGETFRRRFRLDAAILKSKRTLSEDQFRRRLLGLWVANGRGWYNTDAMRRVLRTALVPMLYRENPDDLFALGVDIAPGQSSKADLCAFVAWRLRPVRSVENAGLRSGETAVEAWDTKWTIEASGQRFHASPVFAASLRDLSAVQVSGFIHQIHEAFQLSAIVLDPGGGGAWVYKELVKSKQEIQGEIREVTPLATADEPMVIDKQPIVIFFKRKSPLDSLWQPRFQQSDEGIVQAAHEMLRDSAEGHEFEWPQLIQNRAGGGVRAWSHQMRKVQETLDRTWNQICGVRFKANGNNEPIMSARGFYMFEAGPMPERGAKGANSKKKDLAYAALYGWCGVKHVLSRLAYSGDDDGDDDFSA